MSLFFNDVLNFWTMQAQIEKESSKFVFLDQKYVNLLSAFIIHHI